MPGPYDPPPTVSVDAEPERPGRGGLVLVAGHQGHRPAGDEVDHVRQDQGEVDRAERPQSLLARQADRESA